MLHRSFINGILKISLPVLIYVSLFSTAAFAADKSKHVILITIDGMRSEMVTDSTMPSPNLKMMKRNGVFVKRIVGIAPSATYPSHTTIITGVKPAKHHIFYNTPFVGNTKNEISYWYADSIKSPTIWDIAQKNGLSVASLFWPVSVGAKSVKYNVPEFWSEKSVANQLDYIKPYCTPAGFLDELEKEATGDLTHENFEAGSMARESKTAAMVNYIMNRYKPNLMTVHLITTDYAQHATGTESYLVRAAVGGADHAVGLILENLRRKNLMDSTVVIVCGDHGFADSFRDIAPNVWLVQAGLLGEETESEWKACFHGSGATAFLYLKDADDVKSLNKVRKKLSSLPYSTRSLFRIVEKEELIAAGCDPRVVLAVEPVKGAGITMKRKGPDIIDKFGGKHGYISGIDPTVLLVYGRDITPNEIDVMDQTDIASYVMKLLGVDSL